MSRRYSLPRPLVAGFALVLLALLPCAGAVVMAATDLQVEQSTQIVPSPEGVSTELAPALAMIRRLSSPYFAGPVGENGFASIPNIQSETSVAASGNQVVIGFNDFRGSTSLTGIVYSADGGATFTDFGQLPTAGGTSAVQGDPVLAVWNPPTGGPPVFFCSSIFRPATGFVSLSIHRSTDGGATWQGPFEVTSATHTTGTDILEDKEWMTVDPETGRLFITWTRFLNPSGLQMTVTYSDNAATGAPPTWGPATAYSARPTDGQGSVVACDPNSNNVYLAWRSTPASPNRAISIVRSIDNGLTWSAPLDLAPFFRQVLPAYGMDRFNSFPSLAVNPSDGGVELVYAASVDENPVNDFGDVFHRRSIDGGLTWTSPVAVNYPATQDRPQIFPTVTAASNGRIDVYWYDESVGSGVSDLTDAFYAFSSDKGVTWSSPVPLTPRPFQNEVGNNFSAPHQGDYIDAGSDGLNSFTGYTWFGDPSPFGTSPEPFSSRTNSGVQVAPLRVRPGTVLIQDTGCALPDGKLVSGETADLTIPLQNFGRTTLASISAVLSSLTPGVTVDPAPRFYPTLASLASDTSAAKYQITMPGTYPCGQPVKLRLNISAAGVAPTFVELSIPTGVVAATAVLLSENFDGVVAPALPAGWSTVNGGGTANPWTTTTTTPATLPNAAFVSDAAFTTFPRLFGPSVAVPAGATYLELTCNIKYNSEQQNARIAFDAASIEFSINGSGSRFASADALEFDNRYTHWITRGSGASNGDRSGWSGNSVSYIPTRVLLPAAGVTTIQPRFSMVTDGSVGIAGGGYWVDDVVLKAITVDCGTCPPTPTLVARFEALRSGDGVDLLWAASGSGDVVAWNLYRGESLDGGYELLNATPIPMGGGGEFSYHDATAGAGLHYYRLAGVTADGSERILETAGAGSATPRSFSFAIAGANPFQHGTRLSYSLTQRAPVRIEAFSISGQRVRTLVDRVDEAGSYSVPFELAGSDQQALSAGVYFLTITAGEHRQTLRVVALE